MSARPGLGRAASPVREAADASCSSRPQSASAAAGAAAGTPACKWAWGDVGVGQQTTSRPVSASTTGHRNSGNSSSVQALSQLNQRLCDENAWLLVELGKWEAGHHQKQIAFAAAAAEQARSGLVASSSGTGSANKLPGAAVADVLAGRTATSNSGNITSRSSGSGVEQDGAAAAVGGAAGTTREQQGVAGLIAAGGEAGVVRLTLNAWFLCQWCPCLHCLPGGCLDRMWCICR
jgi:hypothetical protein